MQSNSTRQWGGIPAEPMDYVRAYENYTDLLEIYHYWHDFAKDQLFDIEINDQIARVCNMILHDARHTNIVNTDSLKEFQYFQNN